MGKKTKLPGEPKKAMSSYMLWMQANREEITKSNPGVGIAEIAKIAGGLWKEMGEEKEEWNEKAKADKERYDSERKKWLEEGGEELLKEAAQQKKANKRKEKAAAKASSEPSEG